MACGPTSWPPFAYYDRRSSSWRTSLRFAGATAASTVYSATWPPQGTTRSGVASAPPTSAPPTAENACSCSLGPTDMLPTPTAHDGSSNGTGAPSRLGGPTLLDQLHLLPTPTASDSKNCTHHTQRGGASSPHQARLLPTPRATDTGTAGRRAGAGFRPPLSQQVLPLVAAETLLPTPRATDGTKGYPAQRGSKGDLMLPSAVMQVVTKPTTTKSSRKGARASTGARTRRR